MNSMISHKKQKLVNTNDAARVFHSLLMCEDEVNRQKEHFWAMGLNTKNVIQYVELVSLGVLDASLVHPREVFRRAIMHGVDSIIVGHNHPSGELTPSRNDTEVSGRLSECGVILGIRLLDHVIINEDGAFVSERTGKRGGE